MNCPNCQKSCDDGATFCPHCEAVLDASFLGDLSGDTAGADTPVPAAPPPQARRPAKKPRRRAPIEEPEPEPRVAAPREGYVGKYDQYWTEDSEPPAPLRQPERIAASPAERVGFKADVEDPGAQMKALWAGFLGLHFEDKMTAASGLGLAVMSLMPWRSTPDGDAMGFLTWGFLTLLLALGALGAVWARKNGKLPAIPPSQLPYLSVGAGALSAIIAVLFAVSAYEKTEQYGKSVVSSSPAFGVFLALICAAGMVVGGLLTSRRER